MGLYLMACYLRRPGPCMYHKMNELYPSVFLILQPQVLKARTGLRYFKLRKTQASSMVLLKVFLCKPCITHVPRLLNSPIYYFGAAKRRKGGSRVVRACQGAEDEKREKRTFLSFEEAGLVELSGLSTHERFLCRLTISSLNLLRVISEQEGVPIEELNAGKVCDWFLKDKLKREQSPESAVLQWDDAGNDI